MGTSDGSIVQTAINGTLLVAGCPCHFLAHYESFIWAHREQIAQYLGRRSQDELDRATRLATEVSAAACGVQGMEETLIDIDWSEL